MPLAHGLQISAAAGSAALTPAQKRFNSLLRQIEQARRKLAAWHDNIALYRRTHVEAMLPLIDALSAERRHWIVALDGLAGEPGWTKAERATLSELICEGAAGLLQAAEEDDAELKALHDRHADVGFDTQQQEARETVKQLAEAMTGLDLGDMDGIDSDHDLIERMRERMATLQAEAGAETADAEAASQSSAAPPPPRRKTAAQQRREAEAQLATQSVREVFRKLASALHPDRESDPVEREAKTALMQRVNQAYAANDLLALLELQLQIEQIDASHVAAAGAKRLGHYNKVLAEQLAELKLEIERTEIGFTMDFGLPAGFIIEPTRIPSLAAEGIGELRAAMAQLRRQMDLYGDKAAMKRWLKREARRLRSEAFGGGFFLD